MKKIRVIITSPSLDTSKNVGGISNLTRLLIEKNDEIEFTHFIVGKEDSQKRNFKWFFLQFNRLYKFFNATKKRRVDIAHINYPMSQLSIIINFLLILISSRINNVLTVVHLRGGVLSMNDKVSWCQKIIINGSLQSAKKIIVLGEKEKEFINSFYGVSKNNIEVLPNSVEVPNESVILNKINNRCLQDLPISILFIGRIDSNKGLKEILDAFKSVKAKSNSFKFYLAGTGPDETSFIAECNNILGDGFKYMGILDYKSKQKLFLQIDVFILPSYFEGLPNGLLETMSYGIVPIVTPVGSIPEVVTDSQTGYFVSVKDSLSLTCVIERIISNKGMLKELGVNCYKKINEKYSISNYIIKLNSIYFEML